MSDAVNKCPGFEMIARIAIATAADFPINLNTLKESLDIT